MGQGMKVYIVPYGDESYPSRAERLIFVRRSFLRRTKGVLADQKLTRVLEIPLLIPWNVNFL